MRRRGGPRAATLAALAVAALGAAAPALGQSEQPGPSIQELRRLADERERQIARLEARLARLEAQQDSLVGVKRGAQAGSAQFEAVSNRIRELARDIQREQRDLTLARQELRSLRGQLFNRYNVEIGRLNQRKEELQRRGFTPRTSAEMRRVVDLLVEYVGARQELQGLLEEIRAEIALPTVAYDPTDDPREVRIKLATVRDGIARADSLIGLVDEQIEEARNDLRMRREARRLQDDLEFWGDDRSNQTADELGQILQGGEVVPGGTAQDPEERIRRLQERRAELVERRDDYRRKEALFDQQLRELYS